MQANNQQFNQLKLNFIELDSNGDGYINSDELQAFMKKQKIFNVPIWKTNDAMNLVQNKMNEDNFIIWIMGCRKGLQDFAFVKFKVSKIIEKMQSAGPSAAIAKAKFSSLNFEINKPIETKYQSSEHFFKVILGINEQAHQLKVIELNEVLGRNPAQIYLSLKFKTQNKGQQIAQKLSEIIQFGVELASQFGPTSLNITTKSLNGFVYIILELNNTFFNCLLKYIEQAIQCLSPCCRFLLELKIASDFTKILQQNFKTLSQYINFKADLQIDGTTLDKIKQKLAEEFQNLHDGNQKTNVMFLFLLEEIKLSSSFSNLAECLQSLGVSEQLIPKPASFANEIKNTQIKDMISQFIPDGAQLLTNLSENCSPEGQISINAKNIALDIQFKFTVEGAFDLL